MPRLEFKKKIQDIIYIYPDELLNPPKSDFARPLAKMAGKQVSYKVNVNANLYTNRQIHKKISAILKPKRNYY